MRDTTTATTSSQCDALIAGHSLLRHPFYIAWSDGTLPVSALKDYAREYGAFIRTISQGWAKTGNAHVARVEEGHAMIWEREFAASLGTSVTGQPQVAEVAALVATARELFSDKATALGALYAFEAQQPLTAQSKLKGLGDHYQQLPERAGLYFDLHKDDFAEPAMLAGAMETLSEEDRARALAACEKMCEALYDALTGVHAPHADGTCEM
jgi:pyrroloquinoline-quinone synthase